MMERKIILNKEKREERKRNNAAAIDAFVENTEEDIEETFKETKEEGYEDDSRRKEKNKAYFEDSKAIVVEEIPEVKPPKKKKSLVKDSVKRDRLFQNQSLEGLPDRERQEKITSKINNRMKESSFKQVVTAEDRQKESYQGGGQIYTVTSTKGGVGKTTISTNLAYLLATGKHNPRVCIVDFMKTHGNVATRLLVPERPNISSWEPYILMDSLEQHTVLSELVVRQRRTGVYVLPAVPMDYELTDQLADFILYQLTKLFDYIVIDMSAVTDNPEDKSFVDYTLSVSANVFAVVDFDNSTISDMQTVLSDWSSRGLETSKISILANFVGEEDKKLNQKNLHEYFEGYDIAGFLPEVEGLRQVHNRGEIITEHKKSKLTKAFKEVFSKYADINYKKPGLLARLFAK